MTSQLVIFRAFLFIFFRPPTLDLKKFFPVNQLIKKIWPYSTKKYIVGAQRADCHIWLVDRLKFASLEANLS